MPTSLSTINTAKDQAATYQPLLLARFTFADGAVLRLSTHPLNAAEGGAQYGGADWYGRISEQSIQQVQALAESGIDLIPSVSLAIADPDSYIYTNWELAAGRGFKGAQLELILVFYNPIAGTFSSDYRIPFIGVCEHPASDATKLTVAAVAKTSLMRAMLPVTPIQQRCPWINPTTTAQRALADSEDSAFYECGETRDLTAAPPCEYTRATCTQANRFGGITYIAPAGMHVREYTSGNWLDVKGITNEARYGDYLPMLYGAAWVEPPVMSSIPDGNYLRGECIVCLGPADIMRVTVNGIELSPANQRDGTPYAYANKDFRYNWINAGNRDGSPNTDVPWSGDGDPYGSMTAIQWTLPRSSAGGDGIPRVRVLAKRKSLRRYRAISSVVVASDVATIYFAEVNNDCAWSGSATVTLSGTSSSALNAAWTSAMLNSAYGPPGMVQITVSGVADGTYTGGFIRYATGGENVAWVIADLLTWTNYAYDDLDIASFCEAAAALESRPCAIVLRQRRSAAEIIRSLRQAHSLLMVPEHSTGKLKLILKRTLADQQPAAVDGSNYNTAISSKAAAGTATNGYAAYRFDAASILRNDQPISLKELSRAGADAPNRISLSFQDRTRDYAVSTLSVVDSDDALRMGGQEIAGGLAVQPDGLTSYADAMRAARAALAEIHRGNDDADTRGTRVFEWETSFRAVHLRVGHLVLLTDTLKGLTNQLVRITKIQPSQNYETVRLTAHWHDDAWYTDAYASTGALADRRDEQAARRVPYIWQPNSAAGVTGDAWYPSGRNAFSLYQWYDENADGSQLAKLRVTGELPQNRILSTVTPPIVATQASTSSSGGGLAGQRSYFFALCPVDGSGNRGPLSAIVRADITDSGSTNSVTLGGLVWGAGTSSWILYGGASHLSLCAQTTGSGTPASITFTGALQEASFGPPDLSADRLRVTATRVRVEGVFTGAVTARTSTTITVAGQTWTVNGWASRVVSILAAGAGGIVPLCHLTISSNTADTLTVSGSPLTAGVAVGDWATIRLKVSESGAVLSDAALAITADAEIGKMLRVIEGTGAGQERRIADNGTGSITLESALATALSTDSIVVIEEPLPDLVIDTTPQDADAPATTDADLGLGNYDGQTIAVRVGVISASGAAAPEWMWPRRDLYISGEAGTPAGVAAPAAPTGVSLTATSSGDRFGLTTAWTAPSPAGGTTAYQIQAHYYTDSGCTVSDGDDVWIDLATEFGVATLRNDSGFWPRPAETRYCKTRVRGLNSANEYTDWALCAAAVTITATAYVEPIPDDAPAAPTSPIVTVVDREANFGLTTNWTAPGDVTGVVSYEVQVMYYRDSGGVTPDSDRWIPLGTVDVGVLYLDSGFWPRPTLAARYVAAQVRSLNAYGTASAWSASSALGTIAVLAAPPTPSAGTATIGSTTRGGVASFNFVITITANASPGTTEGYEAQVRYYSDAGASTAVSEWIPLGWVDPSLLTLSTDYWPRPTATQYAKLRIAGKNADNVLGPWIESGALTIGSGELDLREAAEATFGAGIRKDSTGRPAITTSGLLLNGDFEFGIDSDWSAFGAGWSEDASNYYGEAPAARCDAGSGANSFLYQDIPATPGEVWSVECFARTTTNGAGTSRIGISWLDTAGVYINENSIPISGDSWMRYVVPPQEIPAGAAKLRVFIQVTGAASTGRLLVDQVRLQKVEKLTGSDLARVNGILGLAGGSLSQESKYGTNARPVIIGSGAPVNSDGRPDGSYYIDSLNNSKIYKKKAGSWTGLDVGDVVAGAFVGFTLTLNINSVTTTINNSNDTDWPGGQYPGLVTKNNSSGEYGFVGFGTIGINISGNAYYSYMNRTQHGVGYRSSGFGYPRVFIDASASATGLQAFSPGTSPSAAIRAVVAGTANYGYCNMVGGVYGAGYQVDGQQIVGQRLSDISAIPSWNALDYIGLTPNATYGANEQTILQFFCSNTGYTYRLSAAMASLIASVNDIRSRMRTHGLIS